MINSIIMWFGIIILCFLAVGAGIIGLGLWYEKKNRLEWDD